MNDDDLSYIMGSDIRQAILLSVLQEKGPATEIISRVSMIYNKEISETRYFYMHRLIKGLVDHGFIKHNNVARNRIYSITELGREALQYMGVI